MKPQSTTKQDLFLKNDTTQRYIKWSIFTIIIFFVSLKSYAQSNIARYEKLIENNNFQELERLYSTEPIQNLTFLQFIRHKLIINKKKNLDNLKKGIRLICLWFVYKHKSSCQNKSTC